MCTRRRARIGRTADETNNGGNYYYCCFRGREPVACSGARRVWKEREHRGRKATKPPSHSAETRYKLPLCRHDDKTKTERGHGFSRCKTRGGQVESLQLEGARDAYIVQQRIIKRVCGQLLSTAVLAGGQGDTFTVKRDSAPTRLGRVGASSDAATALNSSRRRSSTKTDDDGREYEY